MSDDRRICENPGCGCRVNSKKLPNGMDVCVYSGPLKYCVMCQQAFEAGVKHGAVMTTVGVGVAQEKVEHARDNMDEAIAELDAVKQSTTGSL